MVGLEKLEYLKIYDKAKIFFKNLTIPKRILALIPDELICAFGTTEFLNILKALFWHNVLELYKRLLLLFGKIFYKCAFHKP